MKETIKKPSLMDYTKASLEIWNKIEAQAENNEGEISEVLALSSEQNEELFQDKAIKAAFAALHISKEATFIDERLKELAARKKALQNASNRLKDYIKFCMVATERSQIKNDILKITVKNTAVWPDIVSPEDIPAKYKTTTLAIKGNYNDVSVLVDAIGTFILDLGNFTTTLKSVPNKTAIKEALMAGHPVPGAVMPDKSHSITIK